MTSSDLTAMLPLMILAVTPIAIMLSIAVHRRHSVSLGIATVGAFSAFACVFLARTAAPRDVTMLFHVDDFGLFYTAFVIGITATVLALGYSYLAHRESHPEEYYVLLLIGATGACAMGLSTHFVSFYLGLEVLSVSQYSLMAYFRRDRRGTEAGLKYLVLAAASAAFLLFGMALVYAELGTMSFRDIANASVEQVSNSVVLLGVAMMFASIGFKLSIVPFHYWTADIYEGAPASVVAFASTAGKIGVFAILVRYFAIPATPVSEALLLFVAVTSGASMILGNLLAVVQTNLKRLLAYSSIAHMGYILVAFLATGETAGDTITFYLIAYTAASLSAFGVIMVVSTGFGRAHDIDRIEDYRGLLRTHPVAASVLIISLLSLTGIPLTAGFLGKLYVVLAGAQNGHWALLVILAISSTMGAYYYLRVVAIVCSRTPAQAAATRPSVSRASALILAGLALLTVVLGTYPAPVLAVLEALNR